MKTSFAEIRLRSFMFTPPFLSGLAARAPLAISIVDGRAFVNPFGSDNINLSLGGGRDAQEWEKYAKSLHKRMELDKLMTYYYNSIVMAI